MKKDDLRERPVCFRIALSDFEKLDHVCHKLDLDHSEILRRVVRLGLKHFDDVEIPGSSE